MTSDAGPARTRTGGCGCSAAIDDVVVSGGVNVPGRRGGRAGCARTRPSRPSEVLGVAGRGVGPAGVVAVVVGAAHAGRRSVDWVAESSTPAPCGAARPGGRARGDPCRCPRPARRTGSGSARSPRPARRTHEGLVEPAAPHRFRGITVREGVLLRGPSGWGEFAPFFPRLSLRRAVRRRGCGPRWRAPPAGGLRRAGSWVPVNVIVPGDRPGPCGSELGRRLGLPHRQGEGRRSRRAPGRRPGPGGPRSAARSDRTGTSASTRTAPGTVARRRVDAIAGLWTTRRRRTGIRGAAVPPPLSSSPDLRSPDPATRSPPTSRSGGPTTRPPSGSRDAADVAIVKVAPLGGVRAALRIAEGDRRCRSSCVRRPRDLASASSAGVALAACAARTALRVRARDRAAARRRRGRRPAACRCDGRSLPARTCPTLLERARLAGRRPRTRVDAAGLARPPQVAHRRMRQDHA